MAWAREFDGVVIRSVAVRYASEQEMLSGIGAAAVGGRWNPPGLKAIYASLSPVTAVREVYQEFESFGFNVGMLRPRVFCGAKVRLYRVLDLTDPKVRGRLGFTLQELAGEDWHAIQREGRESWTQAIGRGVCERAFEGMIVPSARDQPRGRNLIVFPDKLLPASRLEIVGSEELPPHPGR